MNFLVVVFVTLMVTIADQALGESINVIDRGNVILDTFQCRDVSRSKLINRICYDGNRDYLIIGIRGSYNQYCEVDSDTVAELISSESMWQYYNEHIKADDDHDCRNGGVPE